MQERRKLCRRRRFGFRDWLAIDGAMGLWQKAAPRKGDDWPAMAGLAERDCGVDHRRPGA
jgi:hypothetical protein